MKIGDKVEKRFGYRFPGVVVSSFQTLSGKARYVVECTAPEVEGAMEILSEEQLTYIGHPNILTQHRPAYFSGYEDEKFEFETLYELNQLEWVKGFAAHDGFCGWQIARDEERLALMATYEQGTRWFVVGYLEKDIQHLPDWVPVYKKETA